MFLFLNYKKTARGEGVSVSPISPRDTWRPPLQNFTLKVPKREIFDCSDFPDFYTIKSLRVGDLGVKIEKFFTNIWGFI